jgi:hypothetical protein
VVYSVHRPSCIQVGDCSHRTPSVAFCVHYPNVGRCFLVEQRSCDR